MTKTFRLLHPVSLAKKLWSHRDLLWQLSKRDVIARYRGSYLGIAWSFLNPLLLLAVFTIVFSVILQARWGMEEEGRLDFALVLFAGLLTHSLFAECLIRSPSLIVGSPHYVKKVRFPLEILPVMVFLSAAAHAFVSFLILLIALLIGSGIFNWTVVLAPIVFLPLVLLCLGLSWTLASMGVFLRDIQQVMGIVATATLFLSPIFYPMSAIPEWLQPFFRLNPLTFVIENFRAVLIWGALPHWMDIGVLTAVCLMIALFGYAWFQRTRNGFADVL